MYNTLNRNASKDLKIFLRYIFKVFHTSTGKYSKISSFLTSFCQETLKVEVSCYIILIYVCLCSNIITFLLCHGKCDLVKARRQHCIFYCPFSC